MVECVSVTVSAVEVSLKLLKHPKEQTSLRSIVYCAKHYTLKEHGSYDTWLLQQSFEVEIWVNLFIDSQVLNCIGQEAG